MRWTLWAAGTAWGPRDRGPRAEAPTECHARRIPERTARPERIRGGRARAGARETALLGAALFAQSQCAVRLRSCSEGAEAAKVSRISTASSAPRVPSPPVAPQDAPSSQTGSCSAHASECGPSASLDVNPDRPTRRAGPALCRGPAPSPASLSAWELPSPRTKPPACPSQRRGGRRGETSSHPSHSAYF